MKNLIFIFFSLKTKMLEMEPKIYLVYTDKIKQTKLSKINKYNILFFSDATKFYCNL